MNKINLSKSSNTENKQYLIFEEHDEENISPEIVEEEPIDKNDILNLARQANGIKNDSPPTEIEQSEKFESDTSKYDRYYSEDNTSTPVQSAFLDPKKPFLKIVAGLFLSSVAIVILLLFRGAWSNVVQIGEAEPAPQKPNNNLLDALKRANQQNSDIKAQLASFEQRSLKLKSKTRTAARTRG
jgi:hypothetical protein